MHTEHQRQAQIGDRDETAQFENVVQVGAGHDLGHQCQHTIRRQLHDQAHQAHHPGLQGVDGVEHFLAFFRVILEQLQRCNTQEGGKNHHADDRGRLGSGQVCNRVLRNERQQ
ncbi:hypothetical protein D3C86_1827510 [compost metagenome]